MRKPVQLGRHGVALVDLLLGLTLVTLLKLHPRAPEPSPAPHSSARDSITGHWTTKYQNAYGSWTFNMDVGADGHYTMNSAGTRPFPPETGTIAVHGGAFRKVRSTGVVQEGTIVFPAPGQMRLKSKLNDQIWTRQ
jgi:hypothetical protein